MGAQMPIEGFAIKTASNRVLIVGNGNGVRWGLYEFLERFEESRRLIEGLVRTVPPSRAHTELVRLVRNFAEVQTVLKEAAGNNA